MSISGAEVVAEHLTVANHGQRVVEGQRLTQATPDIMLGWVRTTVGSSDVFDRALADFGEAYADQNDSDYEEMRAAVDDSTLEAHTGV
jgi:hypothetical protein